MVTTRFPRREVREAQARADRREAGGEGDEADEEGQTLPPTSIEDLTTKADREQFDQTFTDDDASLRLEGAFDPVAGPKQVLPRVAYVLNFNLIYNDSRGRWEPQKKSDLVSDTGPGGDNIVDGPAFVVLAGSDFVAASVTTTAAAGASPGLTGDQTTTASLSTTAGTDSKQGLTNDQTSSITTTVS